MILAQLLEAALTKGAKNGVRVGATHLVLLDVLAWLDELIPCRDHREARLPADLHPRKSRGCQDRKLRCSQVCTRREHRHAGLTVGTPTLNVSVGAPNRVRFQTNDVALEIVFFERNHAVRTMRQDRPGHDLDGVFGARECLRRRPSGLGGLDVELSYTATQGRTVDRHAIHAYAIEGWIITLGVDVLTQRTPNAQLQRTRLYRQRSHPRVDRPLSHFWCDRRRTSLMRDVCAAPAYVRFEMSLCNNRLTATDDSCAIDGIFGLI